jgi:hypothetical protein
MENKNTVSINKWLLIGIAIVVLVIILGGGGYGYSNYKQLEKDTADSLKVRNERIADYKLIIESQDTIDQQGEVRQYNYYSDFKREQKLRQDAENELFIYRNYTRSVIDSILSNYKYRGAR